MLHPLGSLLPGEMLSGAAARALEDSLVMPARALLTEPTGAAPTVYSGLGSLWYAAQVAITELPPDQAHTPSPGQTVEEDCKDAALAAIEELWVELKPHLGGVKLRRGNVAIEKAYTACRTRAVAARAANRAAAELHGRPQYLPISTPQPAVSERPSAAAAGYHTPREGTLAAPDEPPGQVDLLDALLGRMDSAGQGGPAAPGAEGCKRPGKDGPDPVQRAAGVSPAVVRAATRLTTVGVPPLRVKRYGQALIANVLQNSDSGTFTGWAEKKGLSGAQLREGLTTARAMDLAVMELGPSYLATSAAEVQVRRLLSVALAAKTGKWTLAPVLEEVPTEGMLAELPEDFVEGMAQRLKVFSRLEGAIG